MGERAKKNCNSARVANATTDFGCDSTFKKAHKTAKRERRESGEEGVGEREAGTGVEERAERAMRMGRWRGGEVSQGVRVRWRA